MRLESEARKAFFEGTVTVFLEADGSAAMRERFEQVFGSLPDVTIEFVEVSSDEPGHVSVYHQGDVIGGERVERFLRYAEELAGR